MQVTDGGGVRNHEYTYDSIYQITDVNYPTSMAYLATDTQFSYDAAGNRTSVIDGSGTCSYTSNSLNEYTAAGGTSFQYDDSGNMTHDATYAYGYDPENRLLEVHDANEAPVASYTYNAAGRRIAKTVYGSPDVTTQYVYDGDHCLAEYDPNNILLRKYIYGPGVDQPISMIETTGSYAGTYYYHFDALGSLVAHHI